MANTYQRQATNAAKQIKAKGQPVVFYKEAIPSGVDKWGNPSPEVPAVYANGYGLLFKYKANQIDGSVIQAQDAQFIYSGEAPSNNMQVDHGGRTWSVIDVEPFQPTSAVIFYYVQVR